MSAGDPFTTTSNYREAMHQGDWKRAIDILQRRDAGAEDGALPPEEKLILAHLCGLRGDFEKAERILAVLSESPDRTIAVEALAQQA